VANSWENTISVIDGNTNKVINTILVGDTPHGVAINTNKNLVYVTNMFENTVSVINADINSVIETVKVGATPVMIETNSLTNRIYVANSYDDTVSVIAEVDNINNMVSFDPDPSTYNFSPNTVGCQTGAVGKFTFDATLTNISNKELSNLYVEVDELTNNNLLLTDNGLIGEGESFEASKIDDYADLSLAAEEFVDVPFTICLKNMKPFRFFVDVLGMVTKRFEEDKCELIGDWEIECGYGYSNGCAVFVNWLSNPDPGAYATLEFEGTGIYWIGAMTYNAGIFKWIIDEGKQDEVFGEVDTWIPGVVRVNSILLTNKLVPGKHTIKFISLGMNRFGEPLPSETYIDAFDVILGP